MPVGRFVLDVHGESRAHLAGQRCAVRGVADHQSSAGLRQADYRNLDRVYIPLDALARARRSASKRSASRSASPALLRCIARPRRAHRTAAGRERCVSAADQRPAAGAGSRRHPHAGATASDRDLLTQRDPLSERVHLSKPPVAGAERLAGVISGAFAPSRRAGRPSRRITPRWRVSERSRHCAAAARLAAARSIARMRILPRAQREAMFEIYSFCRAVDDIADDPRPARCAARPACAMARGHRRALSRRSRRRSSRGLAQAVRSIRSAARGLPRHHRRHGDGCRRRHPRARLARRSIFIATASPARSAGFRCACSAWSTTPASRSRIISAARCSSPTSCATSTKTPRSAASICRAKRCSGRHRVDRAARRSLAHRGHRASLRVDRRAGAQSEFRAAEAIMARSPRRVVRRAAHHGRGLSTSFCEQLMARGFVAAARAGEAAASKAHLLDRPAQCFV